MWLARTAIMSGMSRDKGSDDRVPFTRLANYIMVLVWREMYILYILYVHCIYGGLKFRQG